MSTILNPSPSRRYIIQIFSTDFKKISFNVFRLPVKYENTCADATWYFYNRLDSFSCGAEAYPYEMHTNVGEIAPIIDYDDEIMPH